jgi:Domain of unknown function (DUF4349)
MFRSALRTLRPPRRTYARPLAFLVVALLAVGACSGSAASVPGIGGGDQGRPVAAPTAGPSAAPTAGPADQTSGGGSATGGTTDGNPTSIDVPNGPLVVRTGSLALEVKDIDSTLLQARARIIGLGGYVSDSERTNSGEHSTALITYRIPAARWDDALDALNGLATKVVGEQTKAVEVTGQVVDLGARIDNLQATERALQAIMVQATKISDILDVQNQLTNVQGQIEELTAEKTHLTDQAALGTLAVTYSLPFVPVPVAEVSSRFSLSTEFDHAVAQLGQVAQALAVAAVWLGVVWLPILLVVLAIAGLAIFIARRFGYGKALLRPGTGLPTAHA